MRYYCNPLNLSYRYQFHQDMQGGAPAICREAADPSLILFQGKYYLFASMSLGLWVSDDLADWTYHRLPDELPLYDYAPDVRVLGDYVYLCASRRGENCDRYRTKNVLEGPWEKIPGTFDYWDPNLFIDDDGRVYFYWGCTNVDPIWGVELDPQTMLPIGEKKGLLAGDALHRGYERVGENNSRAPKSEAAIDTAFEGFLKSRHITAEQIPAEHLHMVRDMLSDKPYIEGAWMDKHNGKYYLQYAFAGTQYNIYGDGVFVSDHPLGPFTLADNNPYSYHPGGFAPGAGHGSTVCSASGHWWHTATTRISINHNFERRIGLWPAGFDENGELFCSQRFGDWPHDMDKLREAPFADPDWFLLSYGRTATASSAAAAHAPQLATDENIQTWWRPEAEDAAPWLQVDLGRVFDVRAVQINFADDKLQVPLPGQMQPSGTMQFRYIDDHTQPTRWLLEGSVDGETYFVIEDKRDAETDLPHDLIVRQNGIQARYLRLSHMSVPYGQTPCISGLRVFGLGDGETPAAAAFTAVRKGPLDAAVQMHADGAVGYEVLWGAAPDKLYHSCTCFTESVQITALVEGLSYCVRVDAFNENGITVGTEIVRI